MFHQKVLHLFKVVLTYKSSFSSTDIYIIPPKVQFYKKYSKTLSPKGREKQTSMPPDVCFFCLLLMKENSILFYIKAIIVPRFRQIIQTFNKYIKTLVLFFWL